MMLKKAMLVFTTVGAVALMTSSANAGLFRCNGQIGFEAGKRCDSEAGFTQPVGEQKLQRDRVDPEHGDRDARDHGRSGSERGGSESGSQSGGSETF